MDATSLGLGLACAALEPGLGGVLLLDATPATVLAAARHLASLVSAAAGEVVEIVTLGSADAEDSLWGALSLVQAEGEPHVAWGPGRLAQPGGPRVVAVPDLARLGLAGARAGVALLGAEVATLQRHGQRLTWAPDLRWVAGCARADAGEVSPHLLDRFALRLSAPPGLTQGRAASLAAWLHDPRGETLPAIRFPGPSAEAVRNAAREMPAIPPAALDALLSVAAQAAGPGARREITLARLCRTLARLEGAGEVDARHVERAAALVGLRDSGLTALETREEKGAGRESVRHPADADLPEARGAPRPADQPASDARDADRPWVEPNAEVDFAAAALAVDPYPEDAAPPPRETASLQPPPHRSRADGAAEGPVAGTRRAVDLRDVAWVSTALEAAKFRHVRPALPSDSRPFAVTRADLRAYRRAPVPQQMLLLVMDYTALDGCDWEGALVPHLRWAYAERASVGVVRVGSARAADPLRADRVVARGVLASTIETALQPQRGTATPLAHGLELAAKTLQAEIQRGRGGARRARLVVLTDGRGNVPLAASRAGAVDGPVYRRGIDDALQAARALGAMTHVDAFFLDPHPSLYPDVPLALAQALRATVEAVAPADAAESEGA